MVTGAHLSAVDAPRQVDSLRCSSDTPSAAPSSSSLIAVMAVSPRPRASMTCGPGGTRVPGAGCGSRIHGERPLASGVGVSSPVAGGRHGIAVGVRSSQSACRVALAAVRRHDGSRRPREVPVALAAMGRRCANRDHKPRGRGAAAGDGRRCLTQRRKQRPTADQARLPSSRMPTMPTIAAISRAGEPSSAG